MGKTKDKYAELIMRLPKNWIIDKEALKEEKNY